MDEFVKWQAFFVRRREQKDKSDWQAASVCHAVTCAVGGSKYKIEDFLLSFGSPEKQYDPDASKANWLAALGIKV